MADHIPLPWKMFATNIFSEGHGNICELSEVRPASGLIEHVKLDIGSPNWEEAIANGQFIVRVCNAYPKMLEACQALVKWEELATEARQMEADNPPYNVTALQIGEMLFKAVRLAKEAMEKGDCDEPA